MLKYRHRKPRKWLRQFECFPYFRTFIIELTLLCGAAATAYFQEGDGHEGRVQRGRTVATALLLP